jgi:hypothetical protein
VGLAQSFWPAGIKFVQIIGYTPEGPLRVRLNNDCGRRRVGGLIIIVALIASLTGTARAQIFSPERGDWPEWAQNLHISGLWQSVNGTFIHSSGIEYINPKNSLSDARNLFQLDVNDEFTSHDRFFLRFWGVYEPPYPVEWRAVNLQRVPISTNPPPPYGPKGKVSAKNYDDFYNQYAPREAWFEHTAHVPDTGALHVFFGKQIVTWGQSVSFRVNDLVNPQDTTWAFGFANLEQSRMPLYMIHPVLELPDWGPFSADFLEAIAVPGFQPLWNTVDYADQRFVNQDGVAGWVNAGAPTNGFLRFSPRPETRCVIPAGKPQHLIDGIGFAACEPNGLGGYYVVSAPSSFPILKGEGAPRVSWAVPRDTFRNIEFGYRAHTVLTNTNSVLDNTELTAEYWNGHEYGPTAFVNGTSVQERYPTYQATGVAFDRPLNAPDSWGPVSQIPLVLRSEFLYDNHEPFQTLAAAADPSAVRFSDDIKWLVGLDVTSWYAKSISETGQLGITFEYFGENILDYNDYMAPQTYNTHLQKFTNQFLAQIAENWESNLIAATWTSIYDPNGEALAMFPSVVLTPPWTNKYFLKAQVIDVIGTDSHASYGLYKGKAMAIGTFQYNFDIL